MFTFPEGILTNSINMIYPFGIYLFCVWHIWSKIDQSKIWAGVCSFKKKTMASENWKVILTGHIIHSRARRIQERETQQILFTAHSNAWQLSLSGISSSIFQPHPSFSIFSLILYDPMPITISLFFLSVLFWKWYHPISWMTSITKLFPLAHQLWTWVVVTCKASFPAPALWEGVGGPIQIFIFCEQEWGS